MREIEVNSHQYHSRGEYLGITYDKEGVMYIVYIEQPSGDVRVADVTGIYSFRINK